MDEIIECEICNEIIPTNEERTRLIATFDAKMEDSLADCCKKHKIPCGICKRHLELKYQVVLGGLECYVCEQCFTEKIRVCNFDSECYNYVMWDDFYDREDPTLFLICKRLQRSLRS